MTYSNDTRKWNKNKKHISHVAPYTFQLMALVGVMTRIYESKQGHGTDLLQKALIHAGRADSGLDSNMAKMVSPYRREILDGEVARGDFRERGNTGYSSPYGFAENMPTPAGYAVSSASGFRKYGSSASAAATGAGGFRGSGGSVRQIPEIYSPLWLNSNLNLPRDRATINAWSRAFFALNPIVHNAVSLHQP